ncbi:hypothetical protein [Algoriphagus confluentis]|uniref:Molybdopterin-binding protein n=1 Tax=Algoriphagus confluentis TaxID=1697556 RepID=A0ABQ6PIR2_9BACT|nr:hypothetical protein Aconfl_04660 [Algoriphagus confluentis]
MNLKLVWVYFLSIGFVAQAWAQQTKSIAVTGEIASEIVLDWGLISAQEAEEIGDFSITNHLGEPRGVLQSAKGVPVSSLLKDLAFKTPSPKQLSEFYFVFEAEDGYKVVFSWNELFNNPLGEEVYFVTFANGKPMEEMEDSILVISKTDFRTGRRHVKNLEKIHVKRVP